MTVPASAPLCIVPAHLRTQEDADHLLRCLVSLAATAPEAEVMVVDDGSPDDDLRAGARLVCAELGAHCFAMPGHAGLAPAVNVGLSRALLAGRDAVIVAPDLELTAPGWLARMQGRTDTQGRPAAVVGARVVSAQGRLRHAGWFFSRLSRRWAPRFEHAAADLPEAQRPTRCPVSTALMLIRLETLQTAGLLDEKLVADLADVDYCLGVFAAGLECIYEPAVRAVRLGDAGPGTRQSRQRAERSAARLAAKWARADLSPFVPEAL